MTEDRANRDHATSLFVSYARSDGDRVRPIVEALVARGYTVWWDALIEGGATFARRIEEKLDTADAVVVVWSASSIDSDWVRDEAARGRDRKRLVPITIDGSEAPLGFRQYHVVDLTHWNKRTGSDEFLRLEAGIAAVADGALPGEGAPIARKTILTRRAAVMAGGAAVASAAGLMVLKPWASAASGDAVAVLPFANLSGNHEQDYFVEGLAEEVRAALVQISALEVAAPTSSNVFRDRSEDAQTIASRLGVGFLLDGSVRMAGQMVRVDTTFTDVKTGYASWTRRFDRELDDVFALQSDIAKVVANAILAHVETSERRPGGTTLVAAYDAFLRGKALFNADQGEASDRAALAKFEEAIALDPEFAEAYAASSRSLAAIASLYASVDQIGTIYDDAVKTARTAVSLAPNLASAQLALGFALLYGFFDFKEAGEAYKRASELGRGDADILLMCAYFASKSGQNDKATRLMARAARLDPLNPRVFRAQSQIWNSAGEYPRALASAGQALELNAELSGVHAQIALAKLLLGNLEEARSEFLVEQLTSLRLAGLAITEQRGGDTKAAQQALDQLVSELGDAAIYQQAQIYAQWGMRDQALAALDKSYVVRDGGLTSIIADPLLASLRGDPRVSRLLTKMGLEAVRTT